MAYKYYKDNRSFMEACVKTGDAISRERRGGLGS